MEISNGGTGHDFLHKLNVRKGRLAVDNHTVEKDTVPKKLYHNCRRGDDWVVMKRASRGLIHSRQSHKEGKWSSSQ